MISVMVLMFACLPPNLTNLLLLLLPLLLVVYLISHQIMAWCRPSQIGAISRLQLLQFLVRHAGPGVFVLNSIRCDSGSSSVKCTSLVNTGAAVTLINGTLFNSLAASSALYDPATLGIGKVVSANGKTLSIFGALDLQISFDNSTSPSFQFAATALVVSDLREACLLGANFLCRYAMCIDFAKACLSGSGLPIPILTTSGLSCSASNLNPSKAGVPDPESPLMPTSGSSFSSASSGVLSAELSDANEYTVALCQTVVVPAGHEITITGELRT